MMLLQTLIIKLEGEPVDVILIMTQACWDYYVFVLCSVFADGQLLVVWSAMGKLPPISLSPALSHLSYLLA